MTTADKIIASIKNEPGEWEYDGYRLSNKSWCVWVANGFFFYQLIAIQPTTTIGSFTLLDKLRFGIAYRKWRKYYPYKEASDGRP